MSKKITGDDCVRVLQVVMSPRTAAQIASALNTDSRAVATALRKPRKDGRVKFGKWINGVATYKFVRSTPAKAKGGAA